MWSRSKRCSISTSLSPTGLQPRLCDVQAASPSQVERGEFDPLQVEAIIFGRKLAEPEALRVLDRGLRPSTTHAGARIELFEQMRGHWAPIFDRLRSRDQLGQLVRAVVLALGRGRFDLAGRSSNTLPRPAGHVADSRFPGGQPRCVRACARSRAVPRRRGQHLEPHRESP